MSRLRPLLAHTKVWVADDGSERLVGLSVVGSHFTFYEFDERGDRVATVAVELPFSNPLTHDFSLTEHYYIVAENPVRYEPDVAGALDGSQPALGPSFVASDDRPGLLALVPRDGSEPIVLEGDTSIVFHYANAWEEGSRIKIAACAFDRYELGAEYGFDAAGGRFDPNLLLRHDNAWGPFLRLSTVDLAAGTVTHETVDYVHRDFPRVHPRREGRPTKYTYVAASPHIQEGEPFFPFQCIQKVALDGSGRFLTWRPSKPGCFVGEPVVAPRPGAVEEDDAWLLVVVHDVHAAATDLVVLDARNLAVAAELRVDRLLPLGLHGTWAPS